MRFDAHRRKRGFSLLELVVVVVIIGIIAAIIVPRVSVSTETAKTKTLEHHIGHLNHLIEVYHTQEGTWPSALTDLTPQYLPDGVPTPPTGGSYTLDGVTHRVSHSP